MTTTQLSLQFSASSRGRLLASWLLASALLALGWVLLAPISTANAGEWVQRSCSVGTEYIFPEGWESKDNGGYTQTPNDNCERFYNGSGLRVAIAPMESGYLTLAGQTWAYKPPAGSTIAGGSLAVDMTAREGVALIGAKVKGETMILAKCESPGCPNYSRNVSITAVGASEIYEQAACFGKAAVCHAPEGEPFDHEGDGMFSAEAEISSAQILLSSNAIPTASGLDGTLLNSTVAGNATLGFTATDSAGPGVYQVRVKVNGEQVLAETPNLNEGKCVATGTSEGARAFNYSQPCPTETLVHAEINTAGLADGTHALTVELEDAAGDVATVYTGTLTTLNHATTTVLAPVERGPCNGSPCEEAAKLSATAGQAKTFTRAFGHSTATLTGRLTSTTGAPIKGAQIKLLQQIVGSAATTTAAIATTTPTGAWKIKVPAGPSRLLKVAYYSHTLDTTPAATLNFHESVQGAVSMHAPRKAHLGRTVIFSGQLAGGYVPASGESVQMEIRYGGRWRTIEVLPTNSKGRWTYRYVFTLGAGTSYLFRAATVPNGGYPFSSTHTKPVRVTVER
jgi:hypothetical protein